MTETSPTPLQAHLILLAACLMFVAGACGGTDDDSADVLVAGGSQFLGDYALIDEDFGTDVTVTVADGTGTIEANAPPNHETGVFPNDGNPNTIS
ncbi:MAG: hypothetical protein P8P85_06870, partial [Acidimicrobiales bacterium]|nr:hypothetical protein [Acidimicrobiales bacterium]